MPSSYEEIKGYKWNEEHSRSAVVMALVNNGGEISNSTIASTLGVSLRTVQRIRKKLEDTWDVDATLKRAPKEEGADRKVRDTYFVNKVKKMVEDDPTRSMRAMARDLGCHEKTIRDCISEDLQMCKKKMYKKKREEN
uniref:Uncharacterized protein n=1 Tax=Lepeophtheirus salmonis TaxID=72036 RepID=A0A0K2TNN5_LEPSM